MQDSTFLDVDRYGVLRIPGVLWLSLAVLARYWILVLGVTVSASYSRDSALLLGDGGIPWAWLAVQLPIALLIAVGLQRVPTAGRWVRALWQSGRWIIALTALLNIVWTAFLLARSYGWSLWPELFFASCALLDLAIAVSVWRDRFFAELFREFPTFETSKMQV